MISCFLLRCHNIDVIMLNASASHLYDNLTTETEINVHMTMELTHLGAQKGNDEYVIGSSTNICNRGAEYLNSFSDAFLPFFGRPSFSIKRKTQRERERGDLSRWVDDIYIHTIVVWVYAYRDRGEWERAKRAYRTQNTQNPPVNKGRIAYRPKEPSELPNEETGVSSFPSFLLTATTTTTTTSDDVNDVGWCVWHLTGLRRSSTPPWWWRLRRA